MGNVKSIRLQVLKMETIADSPVLRKEEQDLLLSQTRGQTQIRDLSVQLVGEPILENAGRRPEGATSVGIWDIAFATVRNDRIPVGLDPSLLFRDPGRQELLQVEVEVRIRQ